MTDSAAPESPPPGPAPKERARAFMLASALGLIAILLSAINGHALNTAERLAEYAAAETALRLLWVHVGLLLLLALASLPPDLEAMRARVERLIRLGLMLFVGSIQLRLMLFTALDALDVPVPDLFGIPGLVTPLGGLVLIGGWAVLTLGAWRFWRRG